MQSYSLNWAGMRKQRIIEQNQRKYTGNWLKRTAMKETSVNIK
jgi:hypothetical protein